ncbi:hypothetical protein [Haladaptatus sp. DFWS20]|uniref:hypothetical protein n=1 Tax=Haladaptatus sp. DFWS20 TaxID=3403467 RepID=UPI003EBD6478
MSSLADVGLPQAIVIGFLLLATPAIAFMLIAGAVTADAGVTGWILMAVAPLALLGTGLYLLTGERPSWLYSVERRG